MSETQTQKNEPSLNFEGKNYLIKDLSATQKRLVDHNILISNQINSLEMQLEQQKASSEVFTAKLRKALAAADDDT
jgi:hypothetical protein